ncbi:MAG TPA: SCO family protein [Gammaproteobacteria bacterium]|nr:SCO family protein [Gammaproteobacteria bacterium]
MLQASAASVSKIKFLLFLALFLGLLAILLVFFISPQKTSNTAKVLVFSKPRELRPFQLNQNLFSQKNLSQHWTFLFFGFTHCSTVCPTTLTVLKEVYAHLHSYYPELQIVFVSIDPEREKTIDLQHYLASYNKDFIGLAGTKEQLENLKQQFGVYAEPSHSFIWNHSSSLFLINPKGQWLALFPEGLHPKQIEEQFKIMEKNYSHV